MKIVQIQKTLRAATRHKNGSLRVRRKQNEADVRELACAGLLEATFSDGSPGSCTAIRGVTEIGQRFLQTFRPGFRFCDGF